MRCRRGANWLAINFVSIITNLLFVTEQERRRAAHDVENVVSTLKELGAIVRVRFQISEITWLAIVRSCWMGWLGG